MTCQVYELRKVASGKLELARRDLDAATPAKRREAEKVVGSYDREIDAIRAIRKLATRRRSA